MEFITLEDMTALYDATLFPDVYRRVCQLLYPDQGFVLRGRIEQEFGVPTLTVEDLECLSERPFHRLSSSPEKSATFE